MTKTELFLNTCIIVLVAILSYLVILSLASQSKDPQGDVSVNVSERGKREERVQNNYRPPQLPMEPESPYVPFTPIDPYPGLPPDVKPKCNVPPIHPAPFTTGYIDDMPPADLCRLGEGCSDEIMYPIQPLYPNYGSAAGLKPVCDTCDAIKFNSAP